MNRIHQLFDNKKQGIRFFTSVLATPRSMAPSTS